MPMICRTQSADEFNANQTNLFVLHFLAYLFKERERERERERIFENRIKTEIKLFLFNKLTRKATRKTDAHSITITTHTLNTIYFFIIF
jgi:hypothetical protein